MKITVEIESVDELERLIGWRDQLRDRVRELEQTPLRFSLHDLAHKVSAGISSLTPDQDKKIRDLIEQGC